MKKLILLRHAKSSWENELSDRNRPLTQKGMARIAAVAAASSTIFKKTERIYSSPANRALHTAVILMKTLEIPYHKLEITESLYTFDGDEVHQFIRTLENNLEHVLLVGHNPAFTETVNRLGQHDCEHLPTAAWASLEFKQPKWEFVRNGLPTYGYPKTLLN